MMARLAHNVHFQRPSHLSLDSKQRIIDEDEFGVVLDDTILDSSSSEMSPVHADRRASFADSASAFSPTESAWPDYSYHNDHAPARPSTNAAHHFREPSSSHFIRSQGGHAVSYGQPHAGTWQLDGTSGSCTPTPVYDGFPPDYDVSVAASYNHGGNLQALHPSAYGGLPVATGPIFSQNGSLSTSPQSAKDWMSASSSEQMELRSLSKRTRAESPSYHSTSSLLRRDGIRKKNARFEIPAERNLRTIDHLINQTNDEHEIKELKQQKRLLRNRQAALDSRQRKKQHTERLEEEKKHFTTIINELEEALGEMKIREAEWEREKEGWAAAQQHYKQYIDTLLQEKEDLVQTHTIESNELRKKNNFLTEQVQRLESTSMSAAPSSTGFSTDFSDFDQLNMGGGDNSPWDPISFVNEFNLESEHQTETSLVVLPPKKEKSAPRFEEQTATSGLLLMLLLCGAWVASNRSAVLPPSIPRMPEDVRVASAAVLDSIYKDAGVQPLKATRPDGSRTAIDQPKGAPSSVRKTTLSANEIASLSRSPLESLHRQLVTPSQEQQRSQLFSLSADQYNDLTSDDSFFDDQKPVNIGHRRNLGEALAALRSNAKGPAAEVYTRSLLWDKISADVVKDFSRMVAECNAGGITGQGHGEPLS